jgi:S-adenosylmethionine decarboxylase
MQGILNFDSFNSSNCGGEGGLVGFEGPEKRLEIDFSENLSRPHGLRHINKDQWQEVLTLAKCTIISHTKNEFFDSYVLSESSLFVYPNKIMIKTCGTTTLLNIIPKVLEYAVSMDLTVELVMFSRKNFLFPQEQVYPHKGWKAEVDYLNNYFEGTAYVLGPLTSEHWYLYLADYSNQSRACMPECTLEIMMHNLDRTVANQFYRRESTEDKDKFPGIADLIEGSETDEFNFTPCGYSMNGLCDEVYSTIHVTPEPQCSYASFETNLSLPSYKSLISQVFAIFKPGTVTLTLFTEKANPIPAQRAADLEIPGYAVVYKTLSELGSNRDIILCNYESEEYQVEKAQRRARSPHQPINIIV